MDSIYLIKGYGRVNALETQPSQPISHSRGRFLLTLAVSALLLLTLIVGSMVAALIHESVTESEESPTSWADAVKSVCSVTQHPDSCFISLTSVNAVKPDPEAIFKLSLQVSSSELLNASLFVKHLRESSNDVPSKGALGDCESQLEDSLSRLNDAMAEMEVRPGENLLTEMKISDIQTWVSAAMTDQETCLDGLQEMGSPELDEVKGKLQKSQELMSNSLAIVAKMKDLLKKFETDMH